MTARTDRRATVVSPVGNITVTAVDGAIDRLLWTPKDKPTSVNTSNLLTAASDQLSAYFAGTLKAFDLPLAPAGTDFQKSVWREMCSIPYGEILTYGDVAKRIKSAAQAVGNACGANPIPIIIPCHRILASNGMGGYSGAGGLKTKQVLLDLEGYQPAQPALI